MFQPRLSTAFRTPLLLVLLAIFPAALPAADVSADPEVGEILERIGVDRGICVLATLDRPELAVQLAQQSELTVYVQTLDTSALTAAIAQADAAGLLGTRVYVEQGPWSRVHLADNLADAVVITAEAVATARPFRGEFVRVLRPLGRAVAGELDFTKPYPDAADDWSHAYHGPDNNPQSTDRLARAPYLTQFQAEPWYVPFPEVTVTSQGRVFKAFGNVGYKERDWPWVNTLISINGYNGTMLWKRPLEEGFNIHRNTMIATPDVLYVADSRSCKRIDTATGEVVGQITAPDNSTGPAWKWMAIVDNVLYALVGEEEVRDPTLRGDRTQAGWPWRPMTPGYDAEEYEWGFGRTFFAFDLDADDVLWTSVQDDPVDSRAVAMRDGHIYCYADGKSLACLDAANGRPLWRSTQAELLEAIGRHKKAQNPGEGFSTTSYMKAGPEALYFAGPQRERLVAASVEDGRLLWQLPHGNYQLVLRDEGLYALGRTGPSALLDPVTGKPLAPLDMFRGNCTRATGTIDSVFTRGYRHGGTTRLDVATNRPHRIALMRPDCNDGVIASGGMLYWGPWMCDCSLSMVGIMGLAPAGDFAFEAQATDATRLASYVEDASAELKPFTVRPGDWPGYRADVGCNAAVAGPVPTETSLAWSFQPPSSAAPAAPIAAGGLVFLSGADGLVRALDARSGALRWKAYVGGAITFPPSIDSGRLFVGSGAGRIYAFEAVSGRPLWQFTAAPAERKISLCGKLSSTWPVASGVLVDDGVVYAAAGLTNYDGTHVYALDATSGRIRWQNNTSGRLAGAQGERGEEPGVGVSVQGHLLLHDGRLHMAGGNVVSPAIYDTSDGRCLNTLDDEWAKAPRGRDLFVIDGAVRAFDRLLYAPKEYWAGRYFARYLLQAESRDVLIRATLDRVLRVKAGAAVAKPNQPSDRLTDRPVNRQAQKQPEAIWESKLFAQPAAVALGTNAVVVTGSVAGADDAFAVAALALDDGRVIWRHELPSLPSQWGLAIEADGRVVVCLEDGQTFCYAGP